ncbi:PIGA, partial [Symbiodinium pilosum]
ERTSSTKEDMAGSLKICMVSDFFHPGLGGVEMHIYQLSECLIQRGHKVIVVTHFRGSRKGVRYMRNGLKVYYLPFLPFHDNCTFPTFLSFFPLIRKVLIREQIDIVHGHQATSNLAHECVLHARTMGYHTVYTDHSLFGFADAACIHVNKLLKFFLTNVEHCICVSHTSRENLVLRASLNPANVSVIPNAVDTRRFTPDTGKREPPPAVTVVVVSRLTYRKGVDLLVGAVPEICRRNPHVRWLIGGSGPKRLLLEEMIERENLHDRVELLGSVPHEDVRKVLVRGNIFLNTSLTEAFCIAIVEAAACGLMVVSTDVGGIPEVLPPHMTRLAAPRVDAIVQALEDALSLLPPPEAAEAFHEEVHGMYSWRDIAGRTEKVYLKVVKLPRVCLRQRLLRFLRVGSVSGKLFLLLVALDTLLFWLLQWLQPVHE